MASGQASGKEVRIGKLVTVKEQVCGGPPAHQRSHLGKPVPDHREPALPPITVALLRANQPFLNPRTCLCSRREEHSSPLPSATARPLLPRRCLRALSSGSGRPHLCLLTARSGRRQRPDARTCSEKGQEGAGWAEEEEEECAHILEHRGRTNHLSTQTLPNSLAHVPAY